MILSVLFTAAFAAQPNDAPPPPPPRQATAQRAKARDKTAGKDATPDAELIGFLGDYEDAADGFDPIGLSEQMRNDPTAAADDTKKDGHGP